MLKKTITDKLHQDFPLAKSIDVTIEGENALILIADEQLKSLSAVKGQQSVYKSINPWLKDKSLHAVSINIQ